MNLNPLPNMVAKSPMGRAAKHAGEQRIALGARLASSLAHAAGTPLNVILGRATMLSMKPDSREDVIRNARIIEEQARVIDSTLRRAVSYLRGGRWSDRTESWQMTGALESTVRRWEGSAKEKGVRLSALATDLMASGRSLAFTSAIDALVQVALDGSTEGAEIVLEAEERDVQPPSWDAGRAERGTHLCVAVRTTRAIVLPTRPHEPWLDPEQEEPSEIRSALAIAAAYEVAREHGGWVEPASPDGSGLRLVWSLVSPGPTQ